MCVAKVHIPPPRRPQTRRRPHRAAGGPGPQTEPPGRTRGPLMVAPAASYAASCAFSRWFTEGHLQLAQLPWLQQHAAQHIPHFGHVHQLIQASLCCLDSDWGIKHSDDPADVCTTANEQACVLSTLGNLAAEAKNVPTQQKILKHMKATQRSRFRTSLSPDDQFRLNRVSLSTVPSRHASSDIAPSRHHTEDTLRQVPMGLFALTCPYELSNEAILVSTALLLGYPVPYARYLRANIVGYTSGDPWGDSLLNKPDHGSASWKSSHDGVAAELAALIPGGGYSLYCCGASHSAFT